MVDAAVGGKTGINFNGLKNEVGVFVPARFVLIDTEFLKSLDAENLRSGYAEMLKHGLISTEAHWADLVNFDMDRVDYKALQALVARSVAVKEQIVAKTLTSEVSARRSTSGTRWDMHLRAWRWNGTRRACTVTPWLGAWCANFIFPVCVQVSPQTSCARLCASSRDIRLVCFRLQGL